MRYGTPEGIRPTSMMSMMFGWWMAFAARASFMKRSTSPRSSTSSRRSTLTAALRPMNGCVAR
jgi:hypothetical protein